MPQKFENAALFERLGPRSIQRIDRKKRSFNFRKPQDRFSVDGKNIFLKTELFENDDVALIIWLTNWHQECTPSISAAGDCCVSKFLRRCVDEEHLMRFQSEHAVFKCLFSGQGASNIKSQT